MITADATGRDFLFPSNQTALELYKQINGDPVKSEIILNTPIVLYTRSAVAQALVDSGIASQADGVYTVDMVKLTEAIEAGTAWADIGLPSFTAALLWVPPIQPNPIPVICLPVFWRISSAAAWQMKVIYRQSCLGFKVSSRSWGIWKVHPPICSTSS